MEVKQIYSLINSVSKEVLGNSELVSEDLTGIVDLGNEVFNQKAVDNYVKSLVNHIGKVVFVNRPYAGKIPSVLMDAWEFGSVLEKISADLPEAEENKSWELTDGTEYSQDVFHKPTVAAKFFNSRVTFEVPVSITERQVKDSFSNAEQLNAFLSMIYNAVEKSITIKTDALIMRTINNMIAQTLLADSTAFAGESSATDYSRASTARCVNLLKLYNDNKGTNTLTAAKALTDPDFIKFASYTIGLYTDRLASISNVFNIGAKPRFTPRENLHVVLLSDFEKAHVRIFTAIHTTKSKYCYRTLKAYHFGRVAARSTTLRVRHTSKSRRQKAKQLILAVCLGLCSTETRWVSATSTAA